MISSHGALRHEVFSCIEALLSSKKLDSEDSIEDVTRRTLLLFGSFLAKEKPATLAQVIAPGRNIDVVVKTCGEFKFAVVVFPDEDEAKKAYLVRNSRMKTCGTP